MRRFGNSDKITEAKEVLTLIRGELASSQSVGSSMAFAAPGLSFETSNAAGSANTGIRTDATIALFDATTPTIIQADDSAAVGNAGSAARRDHTHGIVAQSPNADSVNVAASAEGSATSFARSDHTHNLDESITPTWTGAHTFDDGTGDSPALQLVGGSNNDTAKILLIDDASANQSDLALQLCDTGGSSELLIQDSTPATVLTIDSDGNIDFKTDGNYIGRGSASARIAFNASGNAVKLYSAADLELYSDAGSTQVGLWDGATGNITLVDDAWIGLGAASTRVIFDSTSGNSLDLYSAADLRLFSDAGTTQVGLWDGATGNIQLDDGAGNSPQVQFIGGSNDDTILMYLLDAAGAGTSDLVIQLADAGGDSKILLRDSGPTDVIKIDSDGSIELMVDGAWIGQASGPLLTFDDTNDYLEITGCDVGIGTTAPAGPLDVSGGNQTIIRRDYATDNNTVRGVIDLYRTYSGGAGATGIGTRIGMFAETSVAGNTEPVALIDAITTDATDTAIDSELHFTVYANSIGKKALVLEGSGDIGIGTQDPGSLMEWNFATENLEFVNAGSAGATEQDWIEVQVGGNTGYIRVFASV